MAVTKVSSTVHFVSRRSTVGGHGGAANGRWVPNTDVYVTDTGLVVKVELPGMKSENLEITIEENRSADLPASGLLPRAKVQFSDHGNQLGPFESVLDLPSGYDLAQAKAIYVNGFLRIDVPAAHATAGQDDQGADCRWKLTARESFPAREHLTDDGHDDDIAGDGVYQHSRRR